MWRNETRTVINLLKEGDISPKTIHRTIMLLIKLDAQINRLYKTLNETAKEQYTNGRNDGIRDFAERMKRRYLRLRPCFGVVRCCLSENDLEHLVKEMTEEQNES